jgi:hypothetical protein
MILLVVFLFGCTTSSEKNIAALPGTPPPGTVLQVAELEQAILALGPGIDPEEAAVAARASYEHTRDLAIEYRITDLALVHNVKVNLGLKPRGLCKHWAQDMESRLVAEKFETLTIHRAIGTFIGVDHSTAIISRKGDDMFRGIVIDPWREGGRLTWIRTSEDTRWGWRPQLEVLDQLAFQTAKDLGLKSFTFTSEAGMVPRCLTLTGGNDYDPSTTDLSACGVARQQNLFTSDGNALPLSRLLGDI